LKKISNLGFLHTLALVVVLTGAAGSLGLMFDAGRNQNSTFLLLLFTIWVLSPFIALVAVNVISKRWTNFFRMALHFLMILITLVSLVSYSGAFELAGTKPAFKFLIVPLISWLLIIIIVVLVTISRSRKLSRKGSGQ